MQFDKLVSDLLNESHGLKLILIRGISGSGKTTYAKKLMQDDPSLSHYEADMYFYKDESYAFNPSKLKDAHAWCKAKTEEDLRNGKSVIVSNTFTQKWEIEPYIQLGKRYGADVILKKATGNYQNIHGVPPEALDRMRSRWEDLEGEEHI
jgi:tRNA uridine 5-carbamoylmethylation protein Kti12